MTVKIRVDVLIPNSAERRSTIKGPSETSPKLNGPSLKTSHDGDEIIASGISSGARMVNPFAASLVGNAIDNNPTIKDSTNKNNKDRHQRREGKKLKNVINKRTSAVEILHMELARMGVNKNKSIQENLIRGSITRSQLDLPETY